MDSACSWFRNRSADGRAGTVSRVGLGAPASSKGGMVAGGAGADGTGPLRRNGLLELNDGGWAMAAAGPGAAVGIRLNCVMKRREACTSG